MTGSRRPITPVGSSVDALRRQFGLGRMSTFELLIREWPNLVGAAAAELSRVIELRHGVLRVEAWDPAVADAIGWSRRDLLAAIRERCPGEKVTDVQVRVRRRPTP